MNFIGKALAGVTAVASVMVPVQAGSYEEHTQLARAVASTGVKVLINPPICQQKDAFGWYDARNSMLVVCQENAKGTKMVVWTQEDLDTLRHEAHHVVQDCMDNALDGELESVYVSPERLVRAYLSNEQVVSILEIYEDESKDRQIHELEAFSVATMNNPLEQVDDINKYCF